MWYAKILRHQSKHPLSLTPINNKFQFPNPNQTNPGSPRASVKPPPPTQTKPSRAADLAMAQQQPRRVLRVAPPGRGGARAEAERGEEGEAVFATVQAAVDAVPVGNRVRTVIRLAPGTYREPVYVAKAKNLVTLSGEAGSPEATVITWDNTATRIKHSQVSTLASCSMKCQTRRWP